MGANTFINGVGNYNLLDHRWRCMVQRERLATKYLQNDE